MVQVETQRPFHLSPSELRSENRSWTPSDTDHFPHASPRSVQREKAATALLGFSLRVLGPDPPCRVAPSPESVTGSLPSVMRPATLLPLIDALKEGRAPGWRLSSCGEITDQTRGVNGNFGHLSTRNRLASVLTVSSCQMASWKSPLWALRPSSWRARATVTQPEASVEELCR